MTQTQSSNLTNPLARHFRQPVIYTKLPSRGQYWPEGSLELSMTGELPILAMSTKDEIILRTPDALLNGQGVIDVIHSCCPNIKDAWNMPSIDVDSVIIAIRIASYGNKMDFSSTCPHCNTEHDYAIDLGVVLNGIETPNYKKAIEVDNLKIKLRPQPYFSLNKTNIIAFEEQQLLRSLQQAGDSAEDVQTKFNSQLNKLIDLNIMIAADSTESIELEDGQLVTDGGYIKEFYSNCDNKTVKAVKARLDEYNKQANIKPFTVTCGNEECGKAFEIDIVFDFASFFGKGS
jgi:hypothetical protein